MRKGLNDFPVARIGDLWSLKTTSADAFGPCTIQGLQRRSTHMLPRARDKLAIPTRAIKVLDGTKQEHTIGRRAMGR